MRIGIVTQSYLPIHGGVAQHVHHTALELRRRGHTVKVITAYFNRVDEYFDADVIRIGHDLTVPSNGAFVNITIGGRLGHQLKEIEEREQFDVIHIHNPTEPFMPLIALNAMRAPKVGTFHTFRPHSRFLSLYTRTIRRFAKKLDARIAVSDAAKEFALRYFPADYHIIPNGVDLDRFRPDLDPIQQFNDGVQTILFVGRMDPRKGLKYLLQAFPDVVRSYPNCRLVVVGGGVLAGYYKGYITPEISSKVFFQGYASAEKLPRFYATSDIFCSPATSNESFGIVLIEALAAGTPVVAFDNPGYHTVLHEGKGGILVKNRDVRALSNALIQLLMDPARREQMAREGREFSKQFSWAVVTEQIEAVYRSVVD